VKPALRGRFLFYRERHREGSMYRRRFAFAILIVLAFGFLLHNPVIASNNIKGEIFDTNGNLLAQCDGDNDQIEIQRILDELPPRTAKQKIHLVGNFVLSGTVYIPDYLDWELDGSLGGDGSDFNSINNNIISDASKPLVSRGEETIVRAKYHEIELVIRQCSFLLLTKLSYFTKCALLTVNDSYF